MTNIPQLKDIPAFDIYAHRMPGGMWQPLQSFLSHTQDTVGTNRPRTVSSVVAYHPKDWQRKSSHVEFYVFGSFRSFFPAVEQVARILAPLFQEYSILPIITPIETRNWNEILATDGKPLMKIKRSGILVFNLGDF
jgi:hypothetical protein